MGDLLILLIFLAVSGIWAGFKLGRKEGLLSGLAAFAGWLAPLVALVVLSVILYYCPNRIGGMLTLAGGVGVFVLALLIHERGSDFVDPNPHRVLDFTGHATSATQQQLFEIAGARADPWNWRPRHSHGLHIVLYVIGVVMAVGGFAILLFPGIARALMRR